MSIQPIGEPVPLWPEVPPGTADWGMRFVRNVTLPTLTPFLTNPRTASGAAAIVCPGGAHHSLAIDHEGYDVARWLQARGISAFVLKYRLIPTDQRQEVYDLRIQELLAEPDALREVVRPHAPIAISDGQQAVRLIRSHAAEWGVDPVRVRLIGFSTGGHVAASVALQHDAASRPDWVAPIYGALWEEIVVPPDAPPLFIALASDDVIAVDPALRLYSAWQAAGLSAELHCYAQGGHGFGMLCRGTPSDTWIERLHEWLQARGLLGHA